MNIFQSLNSARRAAIRALSRQGKRLVPGQLYTLGELTQLSKYAQPKRRKLRRRKSR